MDTLRSKHPLSALLRCAEVSKSGYSKWKRRKPDSSNALLLSHIRAIHAVRPYYGYRRMTVALKKDGITVNRKRVYRLMKSDGLQSVIRKRRKYFGKKGGVVYKDLLRRDFSSSAPHKKLATDITYIPTTQGFIYLSVVQDLFNNEILSYQFSSQNDLSLVFETLKKLPSLAGAVLHSDQGFQYTHKKYQALLSRKKIHGSHSRKGNCLDNAQMESFFSHLKSETFHTGKLYSAAESQRMLERHITYYNTERFQKRLGQLSPIEYREKLAA